MTDAVIDAPPVEETWGMKAVRSVLSMSPAGNSRRLPFARTLGLSASVHLIDVGYGTLALDWDAHSDLDSMDGIIQGGVLNVVADYAQGHCFSTVLDKPQGFSTVDFQTRFLRPVPSGQSYAVTSKVLERTRRTALIETWFRRADGKPTTHVLGTWQIVDRAFEVKSS